MSEIELKAREILAAQYERIGNHNAASDARRGLYQPEIAAVVAALKSEPVPRCCDCGTPLLFECTGCSRSNYPPYMRGPIGEIVYSGEGGLQIEFYDGKPLAPMKLYGQQLPAPPEVEG